MATMGKQGIKEVAEQSFHKAHYLAQEIEKINGFKLSNNKPFFNEFLIETPIDAKIIVDRASEQFILPGLNINRFTRFLSWRTGLLIAVTEKRTKQEMDKLLDFFRNIVN